MQLSSRQAQCFGNAERGLERQRSVEFRRGLAKLDHGSALVVHLNLDDAGAGMLPAHARTSAAKSQ